MEKLTEKQIIEIVENLDGYRFEHHHTYGNNISFYDNTMENYVIINKNISVLKLIKQFVKLYYGFGFKDGKQEMKRQIKEVLDY